MSKCRSRHVHGEPSRDVEVQAAPGRGLDEVRVFVDVHEPFDQHQVGARSRFFERGAIERATLPIERMVAIG